MVGMYVGPYLATVIGKYGGLYLATKMDMYVAISSH
jgi:hypothetical protein